MRRLLLNIAMTGMMALLWLTHAVHCQAGPIRGLEFLACFSRANAESQGRSCCGGNCKAIESRQTKTEEKKRFAVPQPESLPWLIRALTARLLSEPDNDIRISIADVPPEFSKCWQFLSRTALPVRAPSFLAPVR